MIAYETSYLWVFICFWSVLAITFAIDEWWISKLLVANPFQGVLYGIPAEPLVIMGGTAILALLWLPRYAIAYHAIRWSNF